MSTNALSNMPLLLTGFHEHLSATRSPRTAKTYGAIAAKFLSISSSTPPTRRDVTSFLQAPRKDGARIAAATHNQALAALRALSKHAVAEQYWVDDPTRGTAFQRERPKDPAVLLTPEIHRFFRSLAQVSSPRAQVRDRAMLALLFTVGLRVHELVQLNVEQIDAESATLLCVRGKGGTEHNLPLEPVTLGLLQAWLTERESQVSPRETALFVSRLRTRLSIRSVERLFERLCTVTGTKKHVTPHTARHSAATLALIRGGDLASIGELLRHSSLDTTRRYLRLVDTRRRHTVGLLSEAIPAELRPVPMFPGDRAKPSASGAACPPNGFSVKTSSQTPGLAGASVAKAANDNSRNSFDDQEDLDGVG